MSLGLTECMSKREEMPVMSWCEMSFAAFGFLEVDVNSLGIRPLFQSSLFFIFCAFGLCQHSLKTYGHHPEVHFSMRVSKFSMATAL